MPKTAEIPKGLEEFIEVGEEVHVEWAKLAGLKRRQELEGQEPDFSSIFDRVLEFLKSLGRLTYQEGSFYLSCGGFNFGPKLSWGQDPFSFSTRKDAEDYAKAFGCYMTPSVDLYKVAKNRRYELLERGVNRK